MSGVSTGPPASSKTTSVTESGDTFWTRGTEGISSLAGSYSSCQWDKNGTSHLHGAVEEAVYTASPELRNRGLPPDPSIYLLFHPKSAQLLFQELTESVACYSLQSLAGSLG